MLSLTAHEGGWEGLADVVAINLLAFGGNEARANALTLIGEEVFVGGVEGTATPTPTPTALSTATGTATPTRTPTIAHAHSPTPTGTVGATATRSVGPAPGAAVDGYLTTDMNAVRGIVTAGIHCEYCHKVGGVYLDPMTETVYPNAPGVQSQRLLRPPPGDNIFFGPYDDVPDPDTYLPVISESAFCAPCHQFSMWGTPIYESYGELL